MVKSDSIIEVFQSSRDVADIYFTNAQIAFKKGKIESLSRIECMYKEFFFITDHVLQDVDNGCLIKNEFLATYRRIGQQIYNMLLELRNKQNSKIICLADERIKRFK